MHQNNLIERGDVSMYGVTGSKHWAEDAIYKLLSDKKHHSFNEILEFITIETGIYMKRATLSCVLNRLKHKNGNIVSYRIGVFQYIGEDK